MRIERRIASADLHPGRLRRVLRNVDLAAGGLATCGLVLAGAWALNLLPTDTVAWAALARLYRLPMLGLFAAGALLAMAYALVERSEPILWVLAALALLTPSLPWAVRAWPFLDPVAATYYALYPVAALAFALHWLVRERPRLRRLYPPPPDER